MTIHHEAHHEASMNRHPAGHVALAFFSVRPCRGTWRDSDASPFAIAVSPGCGQPLPIEVWCHAGQVAGQQSWSDLEARSAVSMGPYGA